MRLEWDEAKRRANLIKHGIDFRDLGPVFDDESRIETEDRRRDYGERRFVLLGLSGGRLLHVTYTVRRSAAASSPPARPILGSDGSMHDTEPITKAVVTRDGRLLIEQPDGSFRLAEGETDWARVDAMSEEELAAAIADDPDDPGNDPTFWEKARPIYPVPKARITIRLDRDIVDFFKRQGAGYQTRIQAVLRSYVEAHRQR